MPFKDKTVSSKADNISETWWVDSNDVVRFAIRTRQKEK